MKGWFYLSSLWSISLLFACMTLLTACGDDDETDVNGGHVTEKSITAHDIQGIWTTVLEEDNNLWVFDEDNTGVLYEHYDNENKGAEISHFNYSVNVEEKTVSISPTDSESGLQDETITLQSLSDGQLECSIMGNFVMLKGLSSMPTICDKPAPRTFLVESKQTIHCYAKSCFLTIYNYDEDNDFTFTTDADWLTYDSLFIGKDFDNSTFGHYRYLRADFTPGFNYSSEERYAAVTVTRRTTGESYVVVFVQSPHLTLEVRRWNYDFTYNGQTYYGFYLNSAGSDGKFAFVIEMANYDTNPVEMTRSAGWISLIQTHVSDATIGDGGHYYSYDFSVQKNTGYDRKMTVRFSKTNGESESLVVVQQGPRGPVGGYLGDGDCGYCNGSGICKHCAGKGYYNVGFGGDITCYMCSGTGKCAFCDGTGWKKDNGGSGGGGNSGGGSSGGGSTTGGKCKWCLGNGKCYSYINSTNDKYFCHGSGKCQWCNGDGWYYGLLFKKMMCTNCNKPGNDQKGILGDGKCSWCGGTGTCKHCNGTGGE